MIDRRQPVRQWLLALLVAIGGSANATAQVLEDSPRMTPLVKVIQEIEPAVIALFTPLEEKFKYQSGSGTVIHPDGYVLTNHHVVPRVEGFAVIDNKPVRFIVVGRLPEKDIALLRLLKVSSRLTTVPLGHSHDLMNGESVVVAGNPGGRGIVYTSGIVSSKSLLLGAPNALVMTQFSTDRRDDFIQFDAASNRGNSGGPLVNMEGKLVGVVSQLIPQEQNVGFAIPVDRVRRLLDRVLDPEVVYSRSMGVRLNALADQAFVADVAAGSTGARAGLRSGDTIVSAGGKQLRNAADWTLLLHQHLPTGKPLKIVARRGDTNLPMTLMPDKKPPLEPVTAENVEEGLQYKFYHGKYNLLPDFESMIPERTGVVTSVDLDAIRGDRDDEFAVSISGLMKIEKEDLYRMTIISDDGSRVFLHGDLFIDHDGNHPPTAASRLVRVKAGLHPIRIDQYEGSGGQELVLKLERFNQSPDETGDIQFFHQPE